MSLLTKRIFSGISFRSLLNHDSNIIRTQYYTCFSNPCHVQSQNEKKFGQQRISSVKAVRELNLDFRTANNLFSKAMDGIFGTDKFKQKRTGFFWYKTLDEVNIEEFFTLLELPDTFYSWAKVIQLHVWMLVFHLHTEKKDRRYIRDGVMEAMWVDVESRAMKVEQYNKSYKKNIGQLFEIFRQSLFWYDYGYFEDDMMLTTIVWSVFFERECDDPEKLEALVRYIRFQMKHLETVKMNDSTEFTGVWTSLRSHCKYIT